MLAMPMGSCGVNHIIQEIMTNIQSTSPTLSTGCRTWFLKQKLWVLAFVSSLVCRCLLQVVLAIVGVHDAIHVHHYALRTLTPLSLRDLC